MAQVDEIGSEGRLGGSIDINIIDWFPTLAQFPKALVHGVAYSAHSTGDIVIAQWLD